MSFPVLIPAAGLGSRLAAETKHINKALVSVGTKPAISRIIDVFPKDSCFVVALGFKGNLLKEYLEISHPDRLFQFVYIHPYEGRGSGLGHSLLSCQEKIQNPFVFISCDTLVTGDIPRPEVNWIGYSSIKPSSNYRSLSITENQVTEINEKGHVGKGIQYPYIGLAGIKDYDIFWNEMEEGYSAAKEQGETYGLNGLLRKSTLYAQRFDWFDTGTPESLRETRKAYGLSDDPNILPKEKEAIWFINDTVVKFSTDKLFISNRTKRAEFLKGFVPGINASSTHMYTYTKVEGNVLSKVVTLDRFKQLMNHCTVFWDRKSFLSTNLEELHDNCYKFYRLKTEERIRQFFESTSKSDRTESINGKRMPTIRELLSALDWNSLCKGVPCRFHGDLHFENIILSSDSSKFTFLDWRQDFAGNLEVGDIYYDLAKILHGLIVSHELVARGCYDVTWDTDHINFDIERTNTSRECEEYLQIWCTSNELDFKKVKILTSLIYLNIAALHHHPYSLLLFSLGKSILNDEIKNGND